MQTFEDEFGQGATATPGMRKPIRRHTLLVIAALTPLRVVEGVRVAFTPSTAICRDTRYLKKLTNTAFALRVPQISQSLQVLRQRTETNNLWESAWS